MSPWLYFSTCPARYLVFAKFKLLNLGDAILRDVAGIEVVDDRPRFLWRISGVVHDNALAKCCV